MEEELVGNFPYNTPSVPPYSAFPITHFMSKIWTNTCETKFMWFGMGIGTGETSQYFSNIKQGFLFLFLLLLKGWIL